MSVVGQVMPDILEKVFEESLESSLGPALFTAADFSIDKAFHFLKLWSMFVFSSAALSPRHVRIFGDSAAKLIEAGLLKDCH